MNIVLIILLIALFAGGVTTGPWNTSLGWGYSGLGSFGLVFVVLLVLLLSGRL